MRINSKGFTLIEALLTVVIIVALGMILSQFSASASGLFSSLEKTQVMTDSFEDVERVLSNTAACTANFRGRGVGLNQEITFGIRRYDSQTQNLVTSEDPVLTIGSVYRGVQVQKVEIIDKVTLGDATHLTDLRVTYELKGRTTQDFVRSLPMVVVMKSGTVYECWTKKDARSLIPGEICNGLTGGALNAIDPQTGNCALAGGHWFTGDSETASCPFGFLPTNANSQDNCNVELPSGFVDVFPQTEVKLSGGGTTQVGRPPYRLLLDRSNKTCRCDWGSDLPASSYASAKCQIYCISL